MVERPRPCEVGGTGHCCWPGRTAGRAAPRQERGSAGEPTAGAPGGPAFPEAPPWRTETTDGRRPLPVKQQRRGLPPARPALESVPVRREVALWTIRPPPPDTIISAWGPGTPNRTEAPAVPPRARRRGSGVRAGYLQGDDVPGPQVEVDGVQWGWQRHPLPLAVDGRREGCRRWRRDAARGLRCHLEGTARHGTGSRGPHVEAQEAGRRSAGHDPRHNAAQPPRGNGEAPAQV